ncbi:helix-turn-helix domain-containing protein [Myxococcota bacterium]|nr:helix-turn-helix domain-containing protein [Myxococcota bacterium]MCZ7619649.1 helix-turn-helix domain-containing protein [Myxococcota bacterium]
MHTDTTPTRRAVSIDEAAQMLGIGRSAAYLAARRGDIPVLRIGRRLVVPIAALDRMLAGAGPIDGPRSAA